MAHLDTEVRKNMYFNCIWNKHSGEHLCVLFQQNMFNYSQIDTLSILYFLKFELRWNVPLIREITPIINDFTWFLLTQNY